MIQADHINSLNRWHFLTLNWVSVGRAAVALLCVAVVAIAPMSVQAQGANAQSFEDVRNQGVHYFKKGRFKLAYRILKRAYGMEQGPKDFVAVFFLAQSASKLLILERAFDLAARAELLAGDNERRKRRANELRQELASLFGKVTFVAAKGETNAQGRIFFETKTGIINKDKRARFMSIRERFRSTDVSLPTTVYLPYGKYLANKVPFTVAEGSKSEKVEIYLQVQARSDKKTWLWVGVGVAALVAVGTGVGVYMLSEGEDPEQRMRFYAPETSQ